jgi:hypothetical protein
MHLVQCNTVRCRDVKCPIDYFLSKWQKIVINPSNGPLDRRYLINKKDYALSSP